MSFISDFFGKGGTGSTLVNTGGSVAIGVVANRGAQIQGDYAVALKKLTNDATLSEAEFAVELKKLDATRDAALATAADQKRNDTLLLVGVIGVLLLIGTVATLLILKRTPKPR